MCLSCYNRKVEKELLQNLNEPQRQAVVTTEGPVLVLAGAGSGKTKALTHRIAYLIQEKKISPYNILAVTFTNKAAGEITSRVGQLLNRESRIMNQDSSHNSEFIIHNSVDVVRLPWAGTFHSVCVKILRREAENVGYSRNFSIYDAGDSLSIIKRIMKEKNIDPKHFNPGAIQNFISDAKNELIDATEYKKYLNSPFEQMTSKVYEGYEKYLRDANAFDFDDLIMQCVLLFQNNPEILEKYQNIFRYILVDEYQDTNQAQYIWTKLLAQKHKNIMVVGDDAQSIYSWRGANFRNILNFEKDYKNATVIKLEQNYRSTKTILEAANNVIKYNKNRTDKKLWTQNNQGKPITIYQALNEKDEAEFVALEIRSLANRDERQGTRNYNKVAVLYRTNAQSRAIEETFSRFKIPYKIIGGFRFYERKEIKDIVAFLRIIQNPNDFEAFERAVSAVPCGIGEKTIARLRQITNFEFLISNQISKPKLDNDQTVNDAEQQRYNDLPLKVTDFFELLNGFKMQSKIKPLDQLVLDIAEKSGYRKFLLDGTPEGEGRWENVLELVGVAEQVQAQFSSVNDQLSINDQIKNDQLIGNWKLEIGNSGGALEDFLQQVSLVQDTDRLDDNNAVTLMTLHSAKGLEFDTVFIVGVEEGLFPHSRAILDLSEMEEERRLCYVGLTRAKERLYLIYARERNLYGRFQSNEKSRFIENIPENLLDTI